MRQCISIILFQSSLLLIILFYYSRCSPIYVCNYRSLIVPHDVNHSHCLAEYYRDDSEIALI